MHSSYCILAFVLIGASLYTMLTCKHCDPFLSYENSLDPEQQILYHKVIKERMNIYLYGLILGLIAGIFYMYMTKNELTHSKYKSCVFASIIFGVQFLFYMLYPKSHYMLNHMKNQDQVDKWLEVYKTMKNRYWIGAILGIFGFFILGYFINKSKNSYPPDISYSIIVV